MCNLYTQRLSAAEVAAHFGVENPVASNAGDEVYPGAPSVVVREEAGARLMQSMTWGFPVRLKTMAPTSKPKPVNNVADLTKPMWKGITGKPHLRCLIPLTAFAEAEGPQGAKTRTWFNMIGKPIFAWAGFWRESAEWGPVFTGLMTDSNDAICPVHDRMPVLLHEQEYGDWLHGSFDDVQAFQNRTFPSELIAMTRTDELWVKRKPTAGQQTLL
ncbi:SOS response-associated peptidase [Sphingobium chungbukense]|uniref:Abasic site processing protein n=1 Tax=Sphingobium chungbukense TaxID=56193 RepID=A0A0M3ARG6_9SPHN|nr:SOS response-associated peptidase family protein [Sphingobium chungbukense]KKW92508.1 hypothetical protein YP76_06015 [Sphingobium chungbukense]